MFYLILKFVHILSSAVLFGTGIGTASVMLYGHLSRNVQAMAVINRYVVLVDWMFTGSSGLLQPITGFWLVFLAGYSFTALWVWGAIVGYLIAAVCWFVVVYLQIKLRDITVTAANTNTPLPEKYYFYFRCWFWLGWPAFISLVIVFYLMVFKPI